MIMEFLTNVVNVCVHCFVGLLGQMCEFLIDIKQNLPHWISLSKLIVYARVNFSICIQMAWVRIVVVYNDIWVENRGRGNINIRCAPSQSPRGISS